MRALLKTENRVQGKRKGHEALFLHLIAKL